MPAVRQFNGHNQDEYVGNQPQRGGVTDWKPRRLSLAENPLGAATQKETVSQVVR